MSNNEKTSSKFLRYIFLTFVITFGLITIIGTAGEGHLEINLNPRNAPGISNLSYSPKSTIVSSVGGTITFRGSIDFIDDDGDVTTVIIDMFDPDGNQIAQINEPIEGVSGKTSGTIPITVSVYTLSADEYIFELYVMDASDHESNVLTGTFDVNP